MSSNPEPTVVLDASAVLAYLQHEPGYGVVREALASGATVSTVNLAEVYAKLLGSNRAPKPEQVARRLSVLGLRAEPFSENDAEQSARLLPRTRPAGLSLGDRACLSLAVKTDLPVLTADRVWATLQLNVEVRVLR